MKEVCQQSAEVKRIVCFRFVESLPHTVKISGIHGLMQNSVLMTVTQ